MLTPNIDRYFLGQGSVFQRSYVQIAGERKRERERETDGQTESVGFPFPSNKFNALVLVCGPSRSSFLTSRRPDSTHVAAGSWCWEQRGKFMTLPYYFRQNGYVTAGNGKVC